MGGLGGVGSAAGCLGYPLGTGSEAKSLKGAPDTESLSCVGFTNYRARRGGGIETMVSEGANRQTRGRSEFATTGSTSSQHIHKMYVARPSYYISSENPHAHESKIGTSPPQTQFSEFGAGGGVGIH